MAASSEGDNFSYIPDCDNLDVLPDSDYVYMCENNTIYGTKFHKRPNTKGKILIDDISSSFLSEPMDVSKCGMLLAASTKNHRPAGLVIAIIHKDYDFRHCTCRGRPLCSAIKLMRIKSKYLQDLFDKIYLDDIIARNNINKNKSVLEDALNVVSSSIGSLTSPHNLANTFSSKKNIKIDEETVMKYLDSFIDAFILYKAQRYDVKGRKYIGSPT